MNQEELITQDMYDYFKLKKNPLVSMFYTKVFQRFKGHGHLICNP